MAAAVPVAAIVAAQAWTCDDALITFRYVENAIAGHGAVFNLGERVQGFTHPLWFLILLAGRFLASDVIVLAATISVGLTLATIASTAVAPPGSLASWALPAVVGLAFLTSDSWIAFQASGLENPLAHLWIALLLRNAFAPQRSDFAQAILMGLLVLTRPDLAVLVAPVALGLFVRAPLRALAAGLVGALPPFGWITFAWLYYGAPLPNTAYAKVGLHEPWNAVEWGLLYGLDWIRHEPIAFAVALVMLVLGWILSDRHTRWSYGVAPLAHLVYVIAIGGDFMRGRFWMPAFTWCVLFGGFALYAAPSREPAKVARLAIAAAFAAVAAITAHLLPPYDGKSEGIVDERAHYRGHALAAYLRTGKLDTPSVAPRALEGLRRYADACGPFTVHYGSTGAMGFLLGPRVSIVDPNGLTDSFVARLPRQTLGRANPRPGHAEKWLPISYLAERGAITIVPGWQQDVLDLRCDLTERARALGSPDLLVDPLPMSNARRAFP